MLHMLMLMIYDSNDIYHPCFDKHTVLTYGADEPVTGYLQVNISAITYYIQLFEVHNTSHKSLFSYNEKLFLLPMHHVCTFITV